MGTRSVVALPLDGGFKGRYIHWDGYPTGVGGSLLEIVQRDGVERALEVLTQDNYGWSSLDPAMPAEFEDVIFENRQAFVAEHGRYPVTDPGGGDGRFRAVEGYGTAYTTVQNQSSPDEWITDTGDDWGTEWAYVLNPDSITVLERVWNDGGHMTGMFGVGAEAGEGQWRIIGEVFYAVDGPTMSDLETRSALMHEQEAS